MTAAFWDRIKKAKSGKIKKSEEKEEKKDKIVTKKKEVRDDKKEKKVIEKSKTKVEKTKNKDKKKSAKRVFVDKEKAPLVERVIIRPVISENALNKQALNQYVFMVSALSNKNMVKKAVETMYGVKVEKVQIMKYKPKEKNFRMIKGKTKGFKKAIVRVESGSVIEFFK